MKNIFCLLFLSALLFLPQAIPAASHMSKSDGGEPESPGREVLIDSSALRRGAPEKAGAPAEKAPVFESDAAKKEIMKFMERENALAGDEEVIGALSKMAERAAQPKAPQKAQAPARKTPGDNNLYAAPYSMGDAQYFPSRRRSRTIQ